MIDLKPQRSKFLLYAGLMLAAIGGAQAIPVAAVRQPTAAQREVISKIAPLTAGECAQLGGKVRLEIYGICSSGLICITADESKNAHMVCLDKK